MEKSLNEIKVKNQQLESLNSLINTDLEKYTEVNLKLQQAKNLLKELYKNPNKIEKVYQFLNKK